MITLVTFLTVQPQLTYLWGIKNMLLSKDIYNGTAHFKKCKQLFEYQHLLLLRDI